LVKPDFPSLQFDIQVNESKRTALHYVRCTEVAGMTRRLKALAVLTIFRAADRLDRCIGDHRKKGTALSARILRRFLGGLNKLADKTLGYLLGPKPVVYGDLNAYVLTKRFDDLPEFGFPSALHVALTKNCNLSCIMCPYHSKDLKPLHTTSYFASAARLPQPLLAQLIEEVGRHGAHLSFGQYDEPFIYKNFARWAVRAKEAGCSVSITTNGTLLDADAAELLISAGIDQISFSLDAASTETYRAIRLDDFELPLQNLRKLVEARNRIGGPTKLRACLVVQEKNSHEQDAFYDLIDGLGLDMVSFYNLSTYSNGIWLNPVLNFGIEDEVPEERSVCSQLYDQMAVYPDGKVALCCLTTMYVGYRDDVPYVGNLQESSLRDIWHSQGYRRIRAEAFSGQFTNSVCRDCTIWHNYQGRYSANDRGHRMYQNAYETIIYLR
jgi:radical SAM protein with 4Fe4S-binding SPASM domain